MLFSILFFYFVNSWIVLWGLGLEETFVIFGWGFELGFCVGGVNVFRPTPPSSRAPLQGGDFWSGGFGGMVFVWGGC